jgi:hypothetical protein
MTKLVLTEEQQRAYDRFIVARNKTGIVRTSGRNKIPWVRLAEVQSTVDIAGMNHPLFESNDIWLEYLEAFALWMQVEPKFRDEERMRMSRGDYGVQDSWEDRYPHVNATTKIWLSKSIYED